MSTRGRFDDIIDLVLETDGAGVHIDSAWDLAVEFGRQVGLEQAEDEYQARIESDRGCRAVAIAALEFLASEGDETQFLAFKDAVEDWKRSFVEGQV